MTSTPKWQSPRRLSQPVAKARPVTAVTEKLRRDKAGTSHRMADRRRGWKRGGAR